VSVGFYRNQDAHQYIDTNPYLSSHQEALHKERDRLIDARAQGPHQWDAKVAAFLNLRKADNAYLAKDNETGDAYLKTAHFLVDIATDFIPFISIPKDVYKAFVGKDPLTGQSIAPFERMISGLFAGVSIASFGAAAPLLAGIKDIGKIANASKEEVRVAEKVYSEYKAAGTLEKVAQAPDKWSRLPKSIQDQMALEEAMRDGGERIMKNRQLSDRRYLGMHKMELVIKSNGERKTVIHYIKDPKTGRLMDFKFKKHSVD
jgi:hypothetical protein